MFSEDGVERENTEFSTSAWSHLYSYEQWRYPVWNKTVSVGVTEGI